MMRTDRVLVVGALDNGRGQSKSFLKVGGGICWLCLCRVLPQRCVPHAMLRTLPKFDSR